MNKVITIPTANMPHEDWLKIRQSGIGGSDAPALILPYGIYKWHRPIDVYNSKVETFQEEKKLEFELGHYLEPFAARMFTEETGIAVHNHNKFIRSVENPFMIANIDRKVVGRNAGLEIKTTNIYNNKRFTDDKCPLEYYVQIQHYLAVTGWDKWYLAVLILNNRFVRYEVNRNDDDIKEIIKVEKEFWHIIETKNIGGLEQWT